MVHRLSRGRRGSRSRSAYGPSDNPDGSHGHVGPRTSSIRTRTIFSPSRTTNPRCLARSGGASSTTPPHKPSTQTSNATRDIAASSNAAPMSLTPSAGSPEAGASQGNTAFPKSPPSSGSRPASSTNITAPRSADTTSPRGRYRPNRPPTPCVPIGKSKTPSTGSSTSPSRRTSPGSEKATAHSTWPLSDTSQSTSCETQKTSDQSNSDGKSPVGTLNTLKHCSPLNPLPGFVALRILPRGVTQRYLLLYDEKDVLIRMDQHGKKYL